jgi:hypothetical protein
MMVSLEAIAADVSIRNGDWYEVARPADVPEHVAVKIHDIVNKDGKLLVQLPQLATLIRQGVDVLPSHAEFLTRARSTSVANAPDNDIRCVPSTLRPKYKRLAPQHRVRTSRW